jgi:nucleoside-diphosphate-sugar epimerase
LFEEANDKYPDADRAKNELGWNPKYSIDEIVVDAYNYANSGRND